MANNVLIPGAGAATAATDDIAGIHYQRVKLVDGTEDSTAAITGDTANGLDVDVTRLPALVAGTANVGRVQDALATPTPSTGAYSASSGTLSGAGTVSATGRCVGCRIFAPSTGDAVVTVSFVTGNVTIRAGTGVDLNPSGIPTSPVVTWVSGTVDVIVEAVT